MKPDQISNTAAFIAVKLYGLTREEPFCSMFEHEIRRYYEQLVDHLPAPARFYHSGLKHSWLRTFFVFWEELLLPGDLMHIILRKWYLTKWVERLRGQGYRQLVVLGAGFDHLAPLNASNEMRCVEFDIPRMIRTKRKFLTTCGYDHPNLTLHEAYFPGDSLRNILNTKTDLNPNKKTIVVSEGFFDYITPEQSSGVMNDLHAYFTGRVTLLSTIFSLHELSGFYAFVYRNSIKLAGEELKLGFEKEQYLAFLKEHQFKIDNVVDASTMQKEVLEPKNISHPVLKGFYLIEALSMSTS